QVPEQEPLHAAIQLDLAECQRLLGRYAEAAIAAAAIDREGIAAQTRLAARSELLRVAVAQNDFSAAQRMMDGGSINGQTSADFDFARFEAMLAFSHAAGE